MAIGNVFNKTLPVGTKLQITGVTTGGIPYSSDNNGLLAILAPVAGGIITFSGTTPTVVDGTEYVQDIVGGMMSASSTISPTYNDAGNTLSFGVVNNSIGATQFTQLAGLSVWGNSSNALANAAPITSGSDGHVLRQSGTTIGFGTIATAGIGNSQVTLPKLANIASNTVIGNLTGGSAVPSEVSIASLRAALAPTITVVTGTSQAISVGNIYIANNASTRVVFTLPATAAIGDTFTIIGKGSAGWRLNQNASQSIVIGDIASTAGTGGYIRSLHQSDLIELICTVANTEFMALNVQGNIAVDE